MPLLLALGFSTVLGSAYLNRQTFDKGVVKPEVMGVDMRNVGIVGGLALALFGGPLLGAVGIGAAVASYVNKDSTDRVVGLFDKFKAEIDEKLKTQYGIVLNQNQTPPPPKQLSDNQQEGTVPPPPTELPLKDPEPQPGGRGGPWGDPMDRFNGFYGSMAA